MLKRKLFYSPEEVRVHYRKEPSSICRCHFQLKITLIQISYYGSTNARHS